MRSPGHSKSRCDGPQQAQCARIVALLEDVGLADKIDAYPSRLSGRLQQRVTIARALVMEPNLVLLSEVTSALDPEFVGKVLIGMQQVAENGMTMAVVTHEMQVAHDVSDRLILIDGGQIVEKDEPGG